MTILYAVICRAKDAAVLTEYTSEALATGSNAPQVTTALLEHLRDNPEVVNDGDMTTYVHRNDSTKSKGNNGNSSGNDFYNYFIQACTVPMKTTTADGELDLANIQENYFHLWNENGIFYCCLSDDPNPKQQKVNFAFLQAIAKDFQGEYTPRRIKNCNAYALDKQFKPRLRSGMDYYNTNQKQLGRDAKINTLMTKVEDMKDLLGRNIQLMLERDEKLDKLLIKTSQARQDSQIFKKKSTRLLLETKRKNTKLGCLIASIFILLILTIVISNCGIKFDQCGSSNNSKDNNNSSSSSNNNDNNNGDADDNAAAANNNNNNNNGGGNNANNNNDNNNNNNNGGGAGDDGNDDGGARQLRYLLNLDQKDYY